MILFFGGSFDPIHNGHLILAEDVREKLGFKKVILIPANISPLKGKYVAPPKHRICMIDISIRNLKNFDVDPWEIKTGGVSYTINTIKYIKEKYGSKPYMLVGADSMLSFDRWKDPEKILKESCMVIMEREGKLPLVEKFMTEKFPSFKKGKDYLIVRTRRIDISSTEIRERVKRGLPIRGMVPVEVEVYIKEKGLYK